jgi:phenylalanyl-tRNA synthetase beta chain
MEIPASSRPTLTALGFRHGRATWPMGAVLAPDVQGEADLVEEVARIASLTKLEPSRCAPRPACPRRS